MLKKGDKRLAQLDREFKPVNMPVTEKTIPGEGDGVLLVVGLSDEVEDTLWKMFVDNHSHVANDPTSKD